MIDSITKKKLKGRRKIEKSKGGGKLISIFFQKLETQDGHKPKTQSCFSVANFCNKFKLLCIQIFFRRREKWGYIFGCHSFKLIPIIFIFLSFLCHY